MQTSKKVTKIIIKFSDVHTLRHHSDNSLTGWQHSVGNCKLNAPNNIFEITAIGYLKSEKLSDRRTASERRNIVCRRASVRTR
jgi:hypothetical protein